MKSQMIKTAIIAFFISNFAYSQDFIILPHGHSHNDYTREVPLRDALKYGFTSIEVDVYWHNERMVVTHDNRDLNEKPTIEELYLDPLAEIVRKNGGTVYRDDKSKLVLMVDLKSDKVQTYLALRDIFSKYMDMMEWYKNGAKVDGPIQVLLTGGPPVDLIEKEENRYFYVDGSVDQWSMDYPPSLMPRASTNYRNYFKWSGEGNMPTEEEAQLRSMINDAHVAGRKIRFWATPDNSEVWKKLLDEGVDWINVDDLKGFNVFYRQYIKERNAK